MKSSTKTFRMNYLKCKVVVSILFIIPLLCYSQSDSIALKREARKFVRQGNRLYNENNFIDASVAYKKALEKNSTYKKATYNLGNSLYQEKNYKEAIPQYSLSAENQSDPFKKAEGFHNKGNSMMGEKNYQGAVDAFKNSLRSNPNDDETRYNLALAQKLLEKENKDKDKKDKDKKDKNKNNKEQNKEQNKGKDKKDENKKGGDDKDEKNPNKENGKGNDNKDQNSKKDETNTKKPSSGKMSPEQIKQLLESLKNEEKKTQQKINARKAKGTKIKQEKDW